MKRLDILNQALLGKWSQRFMEEGGALWHKVICSKYGKDGGVWVSRPLRQGILMVWERKFIMLVSDLVGYKCVVWCEQWEKGMLLVG